MRERVWFLWSEGEQLTEYELREKLRSPELHERALWAGRVMREATFDEVWSYLSIDQIVRDWSRLHFHLGRSRPFWLALLNGWRELGLLDHPTRFESPLPVGTTPTPLPITSTNDLRIAFEHMKSIESR